MHFDSEGTNWMKRLGSLILIFWCLCAPVLAAESLHPPPIDEDLLSVSFISPTEGWASGRWGAVFHTMDAGGTWQKQATKTNYTLAGISFANGETGIAVGDRGVIIRTTDGGANWSLQKSPVPYFLMDVTFVSDRKAFIVTERTHILMTEDAGETWNVVFEDEDYILKAVSFADEQYGWAVGEYGYIYHTADGGVTWEKQAGFFDISMETGDVEGGTFLFDVRALDRSTVWAAGIDSTVVKSEDGGATWCEIQLTGEKRQLFSISSDGGNHIVIGGNGAIFHSQDRGATWKAATLDPPFPYGWFYDIALLPVKQRSILSGPQTGNQFIACGQSGSIYTGSTSSWVRLHPGRKTTGK